MPQKFRTLSGSKMLFANSTRGGVKSTSEYPFSPKNNFTTWTFFLPMANAIILLLISYSVDQENFKTIMSPYVINDGKIPVDYSGSQPFNSQTPYTPTMLKRHNLPI